MQNHLQFLIITRVSYMSEKIDNYIGIFEENIKYFSINKKDLTHYFQRSWETLKKSMRAETAAWGRLSRSCISRHRPTGIVRRLTSFCEASVSCTGMACAFFVCKFGFNVSEFHTKSHFECLISNEGGSAPKISLTLFLANLILAFFYYF